MSRTTTITELEANLGAVLDALKPGEEVDITRDGLTVARLIGSRPARPSALMGMFSGIAWQNCTDDELINARTWE